MKYSFEKMSELALLLNFVLAKAFFVKGFESKLRTPLSVLSNSLYIKKKEDSDILQELEGAFDEIHNNQFVMYKFEVLISSNPMIDISIINYKKITKKSIKQMLKKNAQILTSLGYEATLERISSE